MLGDDARKMPGTLQIGYPFNLVFRIRRLCKVIKAQDVLQRIFSLVYKRQVIQRQVGYQPPVGILAYWRTNGIRRLSQHQDPLDRRDALKLEITAFMSEGYWFGCLRKEVDDR